MKRLVIAALLVFAFRVFALDGQIQIHDPSTIVRCDGKFYTYGTGGSALVSEDGWTWSRGVVPARRGMAPDVIRVGDRYFMYVARNVGAQPRADINLIWSKSLDPDSPDYKWEEGGLVASSDGVEDCNAIDPGALLDPNDGRLWLVYGSYFGYIRLVELNPKTGARLNANDTPVDLAINCEASILIYHDGWYYLLATHGSCCRGADSGYNIRMGRARKVTGPYLDHTGLDMIKGGGTLFAGSSSRHIGPGHFGLLDFGDGVQRFSCHYEADLDRGGASVLDIRPLFWKDGWPVAGENFKEGVQRFSCHYEADLDRGGASVLDIRPLFWKDGWPVAGENFKEGVYEIESARTGTAMELSVQGVPVGGPRVRRGPPGAGGFGGTNAPGGPPGGFFAGTGRGPIPPQNATEVSTNWPKENIDVRLANFLDQAQQKWTISAVTNAGGYAGSSYFKITVAGLDRTLAATEDGELVSLPAFTGGPEQLWRIDQLTDGTWRIVPKSAGNAKEPLALCAIGSSSVTLSKFDPASDKHRWIFKAQ